MENGLIIHSDGGSRGNPGPGACAFTVEENGRVIAKDSKFLGVVTNNLAEYQGVLLAVNWLVENKNKLSSGNIIFYMDSELVVRQLLGMYKVKDGNLKKLFLEITKLIKENLLEILFKNIPREKNKLADYLVNENLDKNISGKLL